jgi:hypothetical protein
MAIRVTPPTALGANPRQVFVSSDAPRPGILLGSPLEALRVLDDLTIAALTTTGADVLERFTLFYRRFHLATARPELYSRVVAHIPALEAVAIDRALAAWGNYEDALTELLRLQAAVSLHPRIDA